MDPLIIRAKLRMSRIETHRDTRRTVWRGIAENNLSPALVVFLFDLSIFLFDLSFISSNQSIKHMSLPFAESCTGE